MLLQGLIGASALFVNFVEARLRLPDNKSILPCHGVGCNDCTRTTLDIQTGYPECGVATSGDFFSSDFQSDDRMSYDVWWDSEDPDPGCKIVINTPAITDEPACGLFLRDWDSAGCYYTQLRDTFNVLYCCGSGDCGAAEPARSTQHMYALHAQGITSRVSLAMPNMTKESGTGSVDGLGSYRYRRAPSTMSQKAAAALAERNTPDVTSPTIQERCTDTYSETERFTREGRQTQVSDVQNCNVDSCSVEIDTTMTTGRTESFSFGINYEIISASTSITFEQSKSRTVSYTYMQPGGTRGYLTFAPIYDCTRGTYNSCDHGSSDGDACSPRLKPNGDQSGEYTFVYA